MASRAKSSTKKSSRVAKKGGKTVSKKAKSRTASKTRRTSAKDAQIFVRGLIIRGEAAKPTPDGQLPPGATHRIVKEEPGELPEVERERFSAY